MTRAVPTVTYESPLHHMTQTTPTCLWNDSADIDELNYAIENGAVGPPCHAVIAVGILKKHIAEWRPRIESLLRELPGATEDQVGFRRVAHNARNPRASGACGVSRMPRGLG